MRHIINNFDPKRAVEVYKNLNSGLLSVRQDNCIVFYTDEIQLSSVELIVNQSGREFTVNSKRRNVHAYAKGYVNEMELSFSSDKILYYNPFRTKWFVDESGQTKSKVEYIKILADGKMFYN